MPFIQERLPPECPQLFGLHPNSEIGFMTSYTDSVMRSLLMLTATKSSQLAAGLASPVLARGASLREAVDDPSSQAEASTLATIISGLLSRVPNELPLGDVQSLADSMRSQDAAPYFSVLVQVRARCPLRCAFSVAFAVPFARRARD